MWGKLYSKGVYHPHPSCPHPPYPPSASAFPPSSPIFCAEKKKATIHCDETNRQLQYNVTTARGKGKHAILHSKHSSDVGIASLRPPSLSLPAPILWRLLFHHQELAVQTSCAKQKSACARPPPPSTHENVRLTHMIYHIPLTLAGNISHLLNSSQNSKVA